MSKLFMIFTLVCCLAACASEQKYSDQLNQQIGKTAQQLQQTYGSPSKVTELANGDEIYTYTSINTEVLPSPNYYFPNSFMDEDELFYPFTYGGAAIPDGNFMGETMTDYCQTKFYLKNNIVTSWQWKGNSCVAL